MLKFDNKVVGYRFDKFTLDLENRQILHAGKALALNTKYFDVLVFLIKHRGQLATKQSIFDHVWGDVIVTDWALSQCIKDIRKLLGDKVTNPRYIRTIPKHGFMFIGDVTEIPKSETEIDHLAESIDSQNRPYKFLDYFSEQDAHLFYGREAEIKLIYSKILAHRTFIIHGRSGVGKSSIVRAGLIPLLKQSGHLPYIFRSFKDPSAEIRNVLYPASKSDNRPDEYVVIGELTDNIRTKRSATANILFFDQFEEFFTILSSEKKQKFLDELPPIFGDESSPTKLVFVLREDLLAEMSRFKEIIPDIFHHEFRLDRLGKEQAKHAIVEPAFKLGYIFEEQLALRILDDLDESGYIDPPQLQIVCDVLFDRRCDDGRIALNQYDRLGGAPKIITGYLERVLSRFNASELIIIKALLKALVNADKQRIVLLTSELSRYMGNKYRINIQQFQASLEELCRARIIRFKRQNGENWVELSHDFIVPEIWNWFDTEETAVKRVQLLIKRSLENYRTHQLLMSKETIELVVPLINQLELDDETSEFLIKSMLNRGIKVPEILALKTSLFLCHLTYAAQDQDYNIRLNAVESCTGIQSKKIKALIAQLALWDKNLKVRKTASIALIRQYGEEGESILKNKGHDSQAGLIRRAVSLAFVRDHRKNMVNFRHLPLTIILMVVMGLIWVRIQRGRREILRQTSGGTLGGAFSGLVLGILLGSALNLTHHSTSVEAVSNLLVLMSLATIAGTAAGLGVSSGLTLIKNIGYRHSRLWWIVGGAFGGATIGGFVNFLGMDIIRSLFGQNLSGLTGAMEGFIMGAGLATGNVLAEFGSTPRIWKRILYAALAAMCAGILLTLIKGNLFSGSIDIIAKAFVNSRIDLDELVNSLGISYYDKLARIALGALEGLLFGSLTTAGMAITQKPAWFEKPPHQAKVQQV